MAEWTFTEEQQQLLDAVRRFCAEHFGEANARRTMESDPPFDRKVWTRLGTELGVLGLSVPEADGGVGGSLVDQAVAVEQFGAALATGPLFGTVYLAVPALVAASSGEARDALLADLVEGTRTAAFASVGGVSADGTALSGDLGPVVDAGAADVLLVAATSADGVGLYAVDTGAEGVDRTPLVTLDLTRPQAAVTLTAAPATLIAGPEEAPRVIEHARHVGSALLAVEQVGAAAHLLDVAVEYAKSRLQFGRPIGSFQAVKHRLADMLVDAEHARSTAYHAVWALADGSDDAELSTAIAQATCSAALSRIAADTIQTLGGIGFTWEHQAHLYFKRAVTDAALLGSAEQHRDRVAELVLDTASADRAPRVAAGAPG
ncbi:acyl-CoA dehydrogenase [Mycobacterium sp. 852013-51886_SCH5428379]|uniref:acyl-CoA dehydrogenase family protein n=1 Tax=Mycobacterium sp. 852013-51886_SCH5428379 TaxID=1834111 RepID=UPI0007FF47AD|nr:acyl-CoA dehydrogenase [Mycobacterium sp. 852013-51886_SCH5428379]